MGEQSREHVEALKGQLRVEYDFGWRVEKMPDRWGQTERTVDEIVRAEAAHPQPIAVKKIKRIRLVSDWREVP